MSNFNESEDILKEMYQHSTKFEMCSKLKINLLHLNRLLFKFGLINKVVGRKEIQLDLSDEELQAAYNKYTNDFICSILVISEPTLLKIMRKRGLDTKGKGNKRQTIAKYE